MNRTTLVVLCFNQERYVLESVRSALEQNHPALEVIVSDDCSTDRTFEKVETAISTYQGHHRVRAMRTSHNLGTLNHLLNVVAQAQGDLIVVQAGDDIAYPNRVSELAKLYRASQAWAVGSAFDRVDENGNILAHAVKGLGGAQVRRWFDLDQDAPLVKGATAAYDRRLFDSIPWSTGKVLNEDIVCNFKLALDERIVRIHSESLLAYRCHEDSIAHRPKHPANFTQRLGLERYSSVEAQRYCKLYDYLLACMDHAWEIPDANIGVRRKIRNAAEFSILKAAWPKMSVISRVKALTCQAGRCNLRYFLPRVLGARLFVLASMLKRPIAE